jgi:hypothetical protein
MKKLIALLFVVAMLCTAMVMPAMAANEAPAITVSSAAAGEGQTATLNIAVENNPGIFSFTMELMYDDTSLELIAVNSDINVLANLENGKVNYTQPKTLEGDMVLFTATFKVLQAGDHEVKVDVITIRDAEQKEFAPEVNDGGIDESCAHKWGKYVVTRKPTCAKVGIKVKTCSLCGEKKTATIAKLAHTIETRNEKAATCTEAGYTGDQYCTVCDKLVKAGTEIAAKGHGETVTKNAKAATCTEEGYTGDKHCADCDVKLEEGKTIAATGHKWGEHKHDKDGHWQTCSVCGENSEKAAHEGNPCSVCGFEKSGVSVVLIVVIAVVVIAAAGACIYFFVIKKKKN